MVNFSTLQEFSPIFVVGNSRSGTTLMGRIIGKSSQVHTFDELHFFEELWNPTSSAEVTAEEQLNLLTQLFNIERNGYLTQRDKNEFKEEAETILQELDSSEKVNPAFLFKSFLEYEAQQQQKTIPCEQTPLNVLYIKDILRLYPHAKIINMIRDPRDVLYSQKKRWQRTFYAQNVKKKEAVRYWMNYHPITISKLWNTNVQSAEKFFDDERVLWIRFEDLITAPEATVQKVYTFANLEFNPAVLDVPNIGSSTGKDEPNKKGIDSSNAQKWAKGGLTATEIFLCEKINQELMNRYDYLLASRSPNPLRLMLSLTTFPIKLSLALLLSWKRIKNLPETIKRRLGKT